MRSTSCETTAVRSVVRAIDLLRTLNQRSISTIDMLHCQTRLPKATIMRMMRTLEECGLVKHAPQHGAYYLTSGVLALSHGYHSEPLVVEAAKPCMDELTRRIKWPVAVAMLDELSMVVRYSTIPLSPLALRHSTLNVRLSLASRAIGRAYLAHCSAEQQDVLITALASSDRDEDAPAKDGVAIRNVLDDVRAHGFATRDTRYWPATNTLAVPVFDRHGVACAVGLTYFASTMTPAQAIARHLDDLQGTAADIGTRLQAMQAMQASTAGGYGTRPATSDLNPVHRTSP